MDKDKTYFQEMGENEIDMMEMAKANLFEKDLARTNLFYFNINSLPATLSGHYSEVHPKIGVMAKSVTAAGKSLATMENNIDGMLRKTAYDTIYTGEMAVEFYLNSKLDLLTFFNTWMESIYNENGVVSFYDNYVVNANIVSLGRDLRSRAIWDIYELYPISIEQQVFAAGPGETLTLNVNFQYRTHKIRN